MDPNYFIDEKGKLRFMFKTVTDRGGMVIDDDDAGEETGEVNEDGTPVRRKAARTAPDSRPKMSKSRAWRRPRNADDEDKESGE